jgi:hypothetical protein
MILAAQGSPFGVRAACPRFSRRPGYGGNGCCEVMGSAARGTPLRGTVRTDSEKPLRDRGPRGRRIWSYL